MAEREAELDEVYGWFREQVASSFGFLVDEFGCGAKTQDEGGDGIFTRFSNRTTAVEVSYDPTDDVVEVFIIKLVNGSTPAYLDSWQWNWVPLSRYLVQIGRSGPRGRTRFRGAIGGRCKRHCSGRRRHCDSTPRRPSAGTSLSSTRRRLRNFARTSSTRCVRPPTQAWAKTSYARPGVSRFNWGVDSAPPWQAGSPRVTPGGRRA